MTQPDRNAPESRWPYCTGADTPWRETTPASQLTATPAATRMTPMLRDLQRARLRQVEYLTRDRIADRRRSTTATPRSPGRTAGTWLLKPVRGLATYGTASCPCAPSDRPAYGPSCPSGYWVRRSARWLLQTVARRRLAAVAAVQTKTTLQRRYPLNKTRNLLPKPSGLQLQTRDLLTRCLGHGHPQRVKRFGMTHGEVDSFSNPRVNPSPTQTSWAVTTEHDSLGTHRGAGMT